MVYLNLRMFLPKTGSDRVPSGEYFKQSLRSVFGNTLLLPCFRIHAFFTIACYGRMALRQCASPVWYFIAQIEWKGIFSNKLMDKIFLP